MWLHFDAECLSLHNFFWSYQLPLLAVCGTCVPQSLFSEENLGELHDEANPPGHGSLHLIQGCSFSLWYFQVSFLGGHGRHFPGWTDSVPRSRGMSESTQPSSASRMYCKIWSRCTQTCWEDTVCTCCWAKSLCSPHKQCFRVLPFLFQPWPPLLFHELCLNTLTQNPVGCELLQTRPCFLSYLLCIYLKQRDRAESCRLLTW